MTKGRRRRTWVVAIAFGLAAPFLARPAFHLARTAWLDRSDRTAPPPGSLDDASGLAATRVALIWAIPSDADAAEKQLIALVGRARAQGIPLSIAGARHSMGGHAIRPDGIVVDMLPFRAMRLDETANILRVQAGALWSDVIPYLNATGRSVAVMQSNSSFSVGGSLSVNCHGWQANRPPIASTVESLRILCADGSVVRCSRALHPELFSLALGGYGLFGVILDADLRVVPNEEYRLERFVVPSDRYQGELERRVRGRADVGMAYGRLSVAPESFLREAILSVLYRVPLGAGKPSRLEFPEIAGLTRAVFRGQVGSDYGKWLRWEAEKRFGGALSSHALFRNQLLSEPVRVFENRSADSTDILHEYFLPPEALDAFMEQLRSTIPRHHGDLLNVTIREVLRDDDTVLRYADRDMLALVMLFNQPRTSSGDDAMAAMTRELIDAALRLGGRYYLPYRLHATIDQFRAAYPQASRFFELKRRYDPHQVFQNSFYMKYGAADR